MLIAYFMSLSIWIKTHYEITVLALSRLVLFVQRLGVYMKIKKWVGLLLNNSDEIINKSF